MEISPKASSIISAMSQRIDEFGGAALIGDYGNDYAPRDTFRGFRYNTAITFFPNFESFFVAKKIRILLLSKHLSDHYR